MTKLDPEAVATLATPHPSHDMLMRLCVLVSAAVSISLPILVKSLRFCLAVHLHEGPKGSATTPLYDGAQSQNNKDHLHVSLHS
jgi:hypothetical protein